MATEIGQLKWHEYYPEDLPENTPAANEVTAMTINSRRYALCRYDILGIPPIVEAKKIYFIIHEEADGVDRHRATAGTEDSSAMHMVLSLLSQGLLI